LAGSDLTVRGDGAQIRAWCFVDDMVEAVLLCLEHPNAVGQSFNIGNPRSAVTIFDLAQRIKRITGCPGDIVFAPLEYVDVEALLADAAGTEHAVAVSSGTAALHVAVLALGLGPGDEVLVPAYTFPATANVVALVGATPVLVDVDPVTMNMDSADAARRVTPRTKAVLAVHLFGRPARLEELPDGLPVIEDAA